jgi:hypothetical protein
LRYRISFVVHKGRFEIMPAKRDDRDDPLCCPATLKLGEIHWCILRAANLMHEKTTIQKKLGLAIFIQSEVTSFGREVGRDEINWWVSKREKDIDGLKEHTEQALKAAQTLKEAADALRRNKPEAYEELLAMLREFAEGHIAAIDQLHAYVRWLSERDVMAPTILFTYRVWGSTRRSERWPNVDTSSQVPQPDALRHLAEVVLGLSSHRLSTLDWAFFEVGQEMYESGQFDEESGTPIQPPMTRVVREASRKAFDECAVYFTEIRDSLRNIIIDIDKFLEERNLLGSDVFWRSVIEKALQARVVEPQLWDFKETLAMWHAAKGPERENAKVSFTEDVASFANARGGVLIIGVTDRREVVGIGNSHDAERRLKFANEVLEKHLDYGRSIYRFHQLLLRDTGGVERLCLLVVAAQACEVVGVSDGEGHYTYPVRREGGIQRVSRYDLAAPKSHMKSDNYDFLRDLEQFVRE